MPNLPEMKKKETYKCDHRCYIHSLDKIWTPIHNSQDAKTDDITQTPKGNEEIDY